MILPLRDYLEIRAVLAVLPVETILIKWYKNNIPSFYMEQSFHFISIILFSMQQYNTVYNCHEYKIRVT